MIIIIICNILKNGILLLRALLWIRWHLIKIVPRKIDRFLNFCIMFAYIR